MRFCACVSSSILAVAIIIIASHMDTMQPLRSAHMIWGSVLLLLAITECASAEAEGLPRATKAADDFELSSGTFPFADIEVFYQMYNTDNRAAPVVLFLHGARFTSEDWLTLGTLKRVRKAGYRAVAIDLPGYGRTRHLPYVDNNMRAEVIKAALEFTQQGSNLTAILVTPSMSGAYAIPFLDRYGLMLAGWVAIAPVGVANWGGPWEYTHKQVRLLAMYGSTDPMRQDADLLTKLFQHATLSTLVNAGHACYMDDPAGFHAALMPFLARCNPLFVVEDIVPQDADL